MSSIITDEQKAIIVKLAGDVNSDEYNAMTKFGGQMYHDGIIAGAAFAMIGVGVGVGVVAYTIIKKKLKEKR